ncbi:MAG: ferrous iron transport protein A [Bacilli bacterium]
MDLTKCKLNHSYIIKSIDTGDEGMKEFLFSLGCFPGEEIVIISILASNFIINIKDARYSIDTNLAKCIIVN